MHVNLKKSSRWLTPFAAAVALAGFVFSTSLAETPATAPADEGTTRTLNKSAVVNFSELARRRALKPAQETKGRAIHSPRPRGVKPAATTQRSLSLQSLKSPQRAAAPQAAAAALQSGAGAEPELGASFLGAIDNQRVIPPDTQGAVGPNHVMTTLNSEIGIQSRSGDVISIVDTGDFWSSLGHSDVFDPKVIYDHFSARWIFVMLADAQSSSSSLVIAVSKTSDPTGDWVLFDVDADTANVFWADYPSIGINNKWLVVSVNKFTIAAGNSTGSAIFVFDRKNLAPKAKFKVFNDDGFTFAPAITFNPNEATEYLVTVEDEMSLRIASITGNVGAEKFTTKVGLAVSPSPWTSASPEENEGEGGGSTANGAGAPGSASAEPRAPLTGGFLPQLGSSAGIEVIDDRVLGCVNRNGTLWCVHNIGLPPGGPASVTHVAVQWWQITPSTGAVLQRARIEDTSAILSYAYPSIAVNQNDDVLIGYSRFSANQYASANYSFRFAADPPNTLGGDIVLKAGEAPYNKDFGSGRNRWGDYSSTVVDPVNDLDMWTLQEYATAPDSTSDRWSTWWGQLFFGGTPDGNLEVKVTPPSGSTLVAPSTETIVVRVSDVLAVTNATISALYSAGSQTNQLSFSNNGTPPDQSAGDALYTATLQVPTNISSISLTLVISAPGKITTTNLVLYSVVPLPPNDNFTNALKVPSAGSVYLSNNKFATTEDGEPVHAKVPAEGASLWWNWSPASDANVLIDTAQSSFDTIVAVYTGNQLTALKEVVSVDNVGTRKQAYLKFDAKGGNTYRIAVASANTNNVGSLHLRIAPGGQPDTNAPVVAISSPPSGSVVGTNQIVVTGTAFDPQPYGSGVSQVLIQLNNQLAKATDGTENWTAKLALKVGLNTIRVTARDAVGNSSAPQSITVTYKVFDPVNDLFANAIVLTGNSGSSDVNSSLGTKEHGEPNHAGNEGGKSVWWVWQAPADGVLSLSTTNSSFDTLLGLYTGRRVNELTTIAGNDDAFDGSGFSALAQAVESGQDYYIAVDGYAGASGAAHLQYAFSPGTVFSLTVTNTVGGTVTPSSGVVSSGATVVLSAIPDPNFVFADWGGSVTSTANPLTIVVNGDVSLTARFAPTSYSDDFESGGLETLNYTTAGDAPWLVQTNTASTGKSSARSGVIGNNQSSSLLLATVTPAGLAAFDYRVSSEANWDFLEFYLNGVRLQRWSGEVGWLNYQFLVTAGTNRFEWRYVKDTSVSVGLDAAFIDNLNLPKASLAVASPQFRLEVGSFPDGDVQVKVRGQANQSYVIQASTDLNDWQPISTNQAVKGVITLIDPDANKYSLRYYRAVAR
jgi:hypothetical protein